MENTYFRRLARCACLLLAGMAAPVWADTATVFKHYQGWRDAPVADWRTANDRVGEAGGWRAYLRESQPATSGEGQDHGASQPKPQAPVDSGRHGHHHGH